jgi:predicted nucleic acid-binding protein
MFLLDTNVLSALMTGDPVPEVAAWISAQPVERLFTAAVCQAEVLSGLAVMPEGRRRFALEAAVRAMFLDDFEGRALPFDRNAADAYAVMFAARKRAGRPVTTIDLMIAAIARSLGFSVVTRNVAAFDGFGVGVVDPWNVT